MGASGKTHRIADLRVAPGAADGSERQKASDCRFQGCPGSHRWENSSGSGTAVGFLPADLRAGPGATDGKMVVVVVPLWVLAFAKVGQPCVAGLTAGEPCS